MIDLLKGTGFLFLVSWIFLVSFHAKAIVDPDVGTTHETAAKEYDRTANPILKDTHFGEMDLEETSCPSQPEKVSETEKRKLSKILVVTFDGKTVSSRDRECFKNHRLDR